MTTSPHLIRVVLDVASLDRSTAFYADVLGLPRTGGAGTIATVDLGSCELLFHERETTPGGSGVALCVGVGELVAVVERWRGLGGAVIDDPAPQPWGETMAVVRDPDGHVVCLVAQP